ncbi:Flp family type IVb pilin [bacterium]|nr:Flp family type IVb pilin [bacterium]
MSQIVKFIKSEDATTAVEYAVMLALILLTIIGSVIAFGGSASGWWGNIDSEINAYF